MEAVRLEQRLKEGGEIVITGLPSRRGQWVEVIVLPQPQIQTTEARPHPTVGQLRRSGLIGLWKDRTDIEDSTLYARCLREQAQNRGDARP